MAAFLGRKVIISASRLHCHKADKKNTLLEPSRKVLFIKICKSMEYKSNFAHFTWIIFLIQNVGDAMIEAMIKEGLLTTENFNIHSDVKNVIINYYHTFFQQKTYSNITPVMKAQLIYLSV